MCGNTFNMAEIEITKDKATFQTLETWIGHNATCYHNFNALPYMLPHALFNIFSHFNNLCVTENSTCYHMRYLIFSLILTICALLKIQHVTTCVTVLFSQFSMVWGYLQCITTCYHQIYKKKYINILKKGW